MQTKQKIIVIDLPFLNLRDILLGLVFAFNVDS